MNANEWNKYLLLAIQKFQRFSIEKISTGYLVRAPMPVKRKVGGSHEVSSSIFALCPLESYPMSEATPCFLHRVDLLHGIGYKRGRAEKPERAQEAVSRGTRADICYHPQGQGTTGRGGATDPRWRAAQLGPRKRHSQQWTRWPAQDLRVGRNAQASPFLFPSRLLTAPPNDWTYLRLEGRGAWEVEFSDI